MQRITRPLQILTDLSKHGRNWAVQHGFDPASFWEQSIVWGDLDSFQQVKHVNNVRYCKFHGRMRWLQDLAIEAGGEQTAENLFKGRGISKLKILGHDYITEARLQRPVNFPDTLLIAHKFVPHSKDPAHLLMHAVAYSNSQERVVTESNAICVWYDYDNLRKASQGPPAHFARAIERSLKGNRSEHPSTLSDNASA
ncbi:hypothetical protein CPB86DRAFT_692692 [Serendipita vermifera]|nr:hypothetical protein CPB86DRAFT_692692 [Serendipita vermifera]